MKSIKRILSLIPVMLVLLSCAPDSSSSSSSDDSLLPAYEGDISFAMDIDESQVVGRFACFSTRTSYTVYSDLPEGYRLPSDLYWDYDPGYMMIFKDYYTYLPPNTLVADDYDWTLFTMLFVYPSESTISLKRGDETLFSLDVRILDGTVTPIGIEESRIQDFSEPSKLYMIVDSAGEYGLAELPMFAREEDYFKTNFLLFASLGNISLAYPFSINGTFYFHCIWRPGAAPTFGMNSYYVIGLRKSALDNITVHYSAASRYIPTLFREMDGYLGL